MPFTVSSSQPNTAAESSSAGIADLATPGGEVSAGAVRTRVLLLADSFLPHAGGSREYYYNIYRGLVELGDTQVTVLTKKVPGWEAFDRKAATKQLRIHRRFKPLPSWKHYELPKGIFPFVGALWHVLRDSPAIIHAGDLYPPGVIAMTLKKMLGVPYIIYCHSEELTSTDGYRYQPRVRNQIYLNSDAVVAVSEFAKQNLLRVGVPEERIHIISPAVNLARLQCAQSQEDLRERYGMKGKLVLLTVGRLISRKGHQLVLRALDKVRSLVPNAHYLIVGKGPEEARLRQIVQEMGLSEHVTFQGLAQEQALADYYNLCDVMVMPNRQEANGDVEGFGMVFLEANAVGKPVVGGRSGGAVEAIADGETGFLVNPDDPEELAATLVRLLSDRDLRERVGTAGARRVRNDFNWDKRSRDLRQLDQDILHAKKMRKRHPQPRAQQTD
jgi:phosphatidylinositol alpha-1,6-mannosyltransferase